MARFHIHPTAKISSLVNNQILNINAELSNMKIETDLRRQLQDNIKRLRDMGTYRGRRHAMSLPVRGQRTRTQVGCRALRHHPEIVLLTYSQIQTARKMNRVERKG